MNGYLILLRTKEHVIYADQPFSVERKYDCIPYFFIMRYYTK